MAAAVPYILAGVSTAATAKTSIDARKGQKDQLAQQEQLASEARANQPQAERSAADVFTKRRRSRSPGFSDAGAASVGIGTYGGAGLGA